MLFGMKLLLEIAILVGLHLFLFGCVQRKLLLLVVAQRNQITVLKRSVKSPKIKEWDRQLWMFLSRIWTDWKEHLVIVKPDTVVTWRRRKFCACQAIMGEFIPLESLRFFKVPFFAISGHCML